MRATPILALIFATVELVACGYSHTPTLSGNVSLEQIKASESDVTAWLVNGLSEPIYIEGRRTLWLNIALEVGSGIVECSGPGGGLGQLPALRAGKYHVFKISPGEKVHLEIPTDLPQHYKGNSCTLTIFLKDGARVGPAEFRP